MSNLLINNLAACCSADDMCDVCVAQNNACHPVIVNDQKAFFYERDAVTTFLPATLKIPYSGGVQALNGYAALEELLNNGGVHSQTS